MNLKTYGGNIVKIISQKMGKHEFTYESPYEYYSFKSQEKGSLIVDNLNSFTVYILDTSLNSTIQIDDLNKTCITGDAIQFEQTKAHISFTGGNVEILVAGTENCNTSEKGIFLTKKEDIYKVTKPWGHELWLNKQHPCYALKQIYIKKGNKTSLQYHNHKQETNVLYEGVGKLHYRSDTGKDLSDIKIDTVEINPISSIDVSPPTLHRIEAISDLLLYEVSTPHLDDVIRVEDDTQRSDGRLEKEHVKQK